MNRQLPTPVRLERHDSINLTTGVVTRSDGCSFAGATSRATSQSVIANAMFPSHAQGLAMNDLESFASLLIIQGLRGTIAQLDSWGHLHGPDADDH